MSQSSSIEKRYKRRRKVLKGFPWEGKFQTKEVYKYFSGDRIQCLLCGKWFKRLPTHLIAIHSMTSDEYKEMYGLPWKHGLCGRDYSLKFSEIMNKRRVGGFRPDIDTARERVNHASRRPDQPFFTKIRAENIRSSHTKRTTYSHKDFQNVLHRMVSEQKTLGEVSRDPDTPSESVIYHYMRNNRAFRKALDEAYAKLPFSVQARANKLNEDKFRKGIVSLQQSVF